MAFVSVRSRTAAVVAAAVLGVGGVIATRGPVDPVPPIVAEGGTTITCDFAATNAADLTSAISSAVNGDIICLTQAVDYGTFSGTTKNLTIVSQNSAVGVEAAEAPVDNILKISVGSGDTGTVTVDGGMDGNCSHAEILANTCTPVGMNIFDAGISTGAANLTVTDFEMDPTSTSGCDGGADGGRCWLMDPPPANANILIDHFWAHDAINGEAFFYIDDGATSTDTGITIQNGLFEHFSTDGAKLTGDEAVTVKNNRFVDGHGSYDVVGAENHTDGIQMLSGDQIITGNWFSDTDQCLFSDDGTYTNQVHHNLVDNCGQHHINVSADNPGSDITFNTVTIRTQDIESSLDCGTNFAGPESQPDMRNNQVAMIKLTNGGTPCVPTANHHNMLKVGQSTTGTGGSNFTGTPTYVGGSDLSTFDTFSDFCLVDGTTGEDDADDGTQVGICGGDYNGSNYGPSMEEF